MKLYDFKPAPSPRKVRMFIAEKGLDIPTVQVDLRSLEQLSDEFKAINPRCTVPTLALDDGDIITESEAICRYLDELHPEPPLFGRDPVERSRINTLLREIELDGYLQIADALRNSAKAFENRALPGPHPVAQISELAERGRQRATLFFASLNQHLQEQSGPWLVGDFFSIADINAYICIDFAKRIELTPDEELVHLQQWYERTSKRPGAQI
ncbi:MAG: glutathione S-transferase [Wenzhouxiangellaceae bacterium]